MLTNPLKLFWSFSDHLSLPSKAEVLCLSWSHKPCFQFPNSGLLAGLNDGSLFMWRSGVTGNVTESTLRFHIGANSTDSEYGLDSDPVPKKSLSTEVPSKWEVVWCHRLNGIVFFPLFYLSFFIIAKKIAWWFLFYQYSYSDLTCMFRQFIFQ